jgi:hypothetical protein
VAMSLQPMELAEWFGRPRAEVSTALHAFMEDHGIVLHPNSDEIWVVHPFSSPRRVFWSVRARESGGATVHGARVALPSSQVRRRQLPLRRGAVGRQ